MKKLNMSGFAGIASAALLAAVGLVPSANAQINLNFGDFTIFANGFSADNLNPTGGGAVGATAAMPGEDTWGIFQITSVLSNGSPTYTDNAAPIQYYGMFYGSQDDSSLAFSNSLPGGGTKFNFFGTGLKLDIYAIALPDVGDALFQSAVNQGPSLSPLGGRTGLSTFTGITDIGVKVFSSQISGYLSSTYNTSNNNTSADGLLTVISNTGLFNTGGSFSLLNFSIGGSLASIPTPFVQSGEPYWTVDFGGTVKGQIVPVPEPSTYGLIAAGALLGLVAFRRMKARAQAV